MSRTHVTNALRARRVLAVALPVAALLAPTWRPLPAQGTPRVVADAAGARAFEARCTEARDSREREIAGTLATPPERWQPSGPDSLAIARAVGEAAVVLQAVADTLGDADPRTARALRGRDHAAYPHALTALSQAYFDVEEPVAGCRVRRVVLLPLRLRSAAAPAGAVIAGRVVDGRQRPVPNAAVALVAAGTEVRTDSAGGFALLAGTARDAAVTVRRLGYGPADFTVPLTPGDTARVLVQLRRVGVLDTVRTVGAGRVPAQLAGFESRRALGRGVFVTREQIAERRGVSTADIVRATGAVRVLDSLGALLPTSQRGGRWDARRSRFDPVCVLRVAVDGIMMNPGFSLGELPPPGELAGIEIYKGAASLPSDFATGRSDSYCGLLAVWTRSR